MSNARTGSRLLLFAFALLPSVAVAQVETMRQFAAQQHVLQDEKGRYDLLSCSLVYIEDEPFRVCDVSDVVLAFALRSGKRRAEYFIAVWNTGTTVFDFHPQDAKLHNYLLFPDRRAPATLKALSYSQIEHELDKEERTASILIAMAQGIQAGVESAGPTATVQSPTGTQIVTVEDQGAKRAAMQSRAFELQSTLNALATNTAAALRGYAKSNSLAPGMMTAGRVAFPKVSSTIRTQYVIEIEIGGDVFVWDNGRAMSQPPQK